MPGTSGRGLLFLHYLNVGTQDLKCIVRDEVLLRCCWKDDLVFVCRNRRERFGRASRQVCYPILRFRVL